ncbi:glutathione peroxidase [Xanthomonas sp. 3058]|uniref:glutathione peroxidase n=1 Tax=Xanthomonas sp. 3058 TaxID=3035314 RepID=UPI00161E08C6|nr:glutathione peroxidase [Xanthomonas sp. 3058]MBB5865401.1 glutathione peroxidase [Xanthomonas sp. 3058]
MSQSIHDIPLTTIDGAPTTLADYRGKVLLVVNVASKCGLTPQYEGLQALYRDRQAQGLEVLGFPANDFNGQEPGSESEIAQFCQLTYDVTFPMFSKIAVTGADIHPLYQALTSARPSATGDGPMREKLAGYGIAANPAPGVLWNFEKFLIDRDGQVIARFAPDVPADDARLREAVETALSTRR